MYLVTDFDDHGDTRYSLTLYGHIKTAQQRTVYSNTVIGTLAGQLMGGLLHLVQRGEVWTDCGPDWLTDCGPAQSPPRCTKYSSPPING